MDEWLHSGSYYRCDKAMAFNLDEPLHVMLTHICSCLQKKTSLLEGPHQPRVIEFNCLTIIYCYGRKFKYLRTTDKVIMKPFVLQCCCTHLIIVLLLFLSIYYY